MIPKPVAGAALREGCSLYQRLFECWNLNRLRWSFIGGEMVSGRMQQVTSALEPKAACAHTIRMRTVPSSAEVSAMAESGNPVLAASYSTISVTFAVCDTDAEVVVTVMV